MSLSIQNLFFQYNDYFPVLEDLSFSVSKGEFIGIFGPNGGGKTTLLKLLLGLLEPTRGKITILDHSPKQISHKIGYVPQIQRFDKQFPISVMEVVLQGRLYNHRGFLGFSQKDKEIAKQVLSEVGLEDRANSPFGLLSGGQSQRTLIARALASQPDILLLDEAMAGVDPKASKDICNFLITLKGKVTILLVTHELANIAPQMDRLLCINHTLTPYTPKEVCAHYAMGLYHPHPTLISKEDPHD